MELAQSAEVASTASPLGLVGLGSPRRRTCRLRQINFTGASACCSNTYNGSILVAPEGCDSDPIYPEAEYFSNNVLKITSGIDETGGMNWILFGFLILAWVIVFSMVYKGVKSTGKAAYVTSTFPLLVLMALVIRGVTLDGAMEGLKYYITPDLKKLVQADTWISLHKGRRPAHWDQIKNFIWICPK